MLNTLFSFSEDFSAIAILSGDEFETDLNEFAGFFNVVGDFGHKLVVG